MKRKKVIPVGTINIDVLTLFGIDINFGVR